MAISKSLRYQILRRDGFRWRKLTEMEQRAAAILAEVDEEE